ncbi:hypothetical protein ERO13_A09G242000v2 [Gossypium hirsutum]|uniref:Proteasome assembly chaperone 4 n=3 Tax=Gossypium TaxID=3633 RepID=A0A5J5UJA6_GOSBA|nr:hypothetical protein ES319_A09G257300v1 [Gossypium barbadense]KAG4185601.1 hypothetical protein ERO13_A09G242000v2 [Gossypium hirsutum]TYH04243.1 hypothetical protein ES288_A09G283400v1 [Gossypium darwinii]TYJ20405.1 hypothetical protein E1A91_A09G262500v1 [Gossypium mustelinum]
MSSPPSSSSGKALDFEAASKSAVASVESLKLKPQDEIAGGVQVTSFSEIVDEVTLHFQLICLAKQIFVWIGCNSANLGNLYAAAPTRPNNTVSVTSILGGASDNTGSGIARRLVLKTGLNIIVACNIPKNNSMLEANAEKKLIEKLIALGYSRPKSQSSGPGLSSS